MLVYGHVPKDFTGEPYPSFLSTTDFSVQTDSSVQQERFHLTFWEGPTSACQSLFA